MSDSTSTTLRSSTRIDPRRWNIGLKIGGVMLVLALAPLVVLAALGADRLREQARSDGRNDLEGVVAAVALALDTEINANLQLVSSIATDPRVLEFMGASPADGASIDPSPVTDVLVGIAEAHPTASGIFLLDEDGYAVASSVPEIVGLEYSYRTYFQDAFAGRTNVSDIYLPIGAPDPYPGTAFAAPITDENGDIVGVAAIKSDALTISSSLTGESDRTLFLVESTGLISSHPDADLRFRSLVEFTPEQQAAAADARRFDGPVVAAEVDDLAESIVSRTAAGFGIGSIDDEVLALAWQPLSSTGWVAVASRPYAEFDAAASSAFADALQFAGIVGAIALALAALAAVTLGRPLSVMTAAARRLGSGSGLSEDMPLKRLASRNDDVGALALQLVETNGLLLERERRANEQLQALKVEIDQIRRESQVGEIVESEFFTQLEARAAELRLRKDSTD
jgi:C4-dicarboxylate-specific signal transduction histidine kinase